MARVRPCRVPRGDRNCRELRPDDGGPLVLVLSYANNDKVAMNVAFYYMANAGGRLTGTVLSGALYQQAELTAFPWASVILVLAAAALSLLLPVSPSASTIADMANPNARAHQTS